MKSVVEREHYRMSVDPPNNRISFEAWGDCVEPELFADFGDDWKKACSYVQPGFTVLGDYTQVGVFFVREAFAKGMEVIFESGVHKCAVFWGDGVLGKFTTEQAAELASPEYAAKRKSFKTREEAEAWLIS